MGGFSLSGSASASASIGASIGTAPSRFTGPKAQTQRTWTPAKLRFIEPDAGGRETEVWSIEFPFNPTNYSITRGAKWEPKSNKQGLQPAEYNGPEPSTITVKMFLDETTGAKEGGPGDISKTVKKLMAKVDPDPASISQERPSAPHAQFIWGTAIMFTGYLKSVGAEYELFRENGDPIRGTVTITLLEYGATPQRQNPTSGGEPGSRAHHVIAGDTLASIAYREYGSAGEWRRIADANPSISDPLRLNAGMSLIVPPA
jgi:hypothetical protein